MRDAHGWLADREAFEPSLTKSKFDPSRLLFNLEYEVSEEGFLVSDSHTEGGVTKGYFYLLVSACGLRFPFSNFIVEVLQTYGVAPS